MGMELSEEQIRHILQGIKIPPQPQILVDLQMEQYMPNPDIERIAELVSLDVGLAGTIIKFVNSPVVGLSNKITSISQAVSILGLNSVINIINGLSIKGEMNDETIVELTGFWDTATDISQIAVNIAKRIGVPSPVEAYTLGLFHNCGIPLMMARFPGYLSTLKKAYSEPSQRITDVENEAYNTNHCVVGYFTAKSWNLPLHICEAISDHHNIERCFAVSHSSAAQKKTLLSILKMAEHLCGNHITFGQQSVDYEWEQIKKAVFEYVGLTAYDLEDMRESFIEMGINVQTKSEA